MHLCIAAIYDAKLWRFSPRTVAVRYVRYVRTYTIVSQLAKPTPFLEQFASVRPSIPPYVRLSIRLFVRTYVRMSASELSAISDRPER